MKVLFLSFILGLGVGVLYGLVKSPAPPIVALLGLLGMVLGEQFGTWFHTKILDVAHAACACLSVNATTVSFTSLYHGRHLKTGART